MMNVTYRSPVLRVLLIALLGVSIPCGVIFRVMQLFYAVDFETGFYKGWHYSLPALDVLLAGAAVLILLFSFFLKRLPLFAGARDKRFSFLPLFCALGTAGQFVLQLLQMEEVSILALVSLFLTAVSVVFFAALAFFPAQAGQSTGAFLFRNVVLALWCCSEMLFLFFVHSAGSNTSEYVFTILFLYFATLFFVRYGKLSFYEEPTYAVSFSLLISGSFLTLFGFLLSVPNFIVAAYISAPWQSIPPFSCTALPLALYGLVFLCTNCMSAPERRSIRV